MLHTDGPSSKPLVLLMVQKARPDLIPPDIPPVRRLTHTPIWWRLLAGVLIGLTALVGGVTVLTRAPDRAGTDWRQAIARGRADFATGSCISCHALYPISSAGGAIDLTHEGRRHTFVWLQHEIRFPTSQRPPTPPGQADDLAAFLASLK